MSRRETFQCEAITVTVEETADALTYTFAPRERVWRPGLPVVPLVLFVGFPLALLVLVGYALDRTNANRPEWELALTAVFVVQLLGWLVVGTRVMWATFRARLRPGTALKFTRTHLWHGSSRVCELEQVRGLRMLTYTTGEAPKSEASLSLVIGEDGGTHGLFGGFDPAALRALADDIHRRFAAFRLNQGVMAPLDALAVIETTSEEVEKLMHTRPPTGSAQRFAGGALDVLQTRWGGITWCAAMLAGLYGSGALILAAGLSPPFLALHALLGTFHFLLLCALLQGKRPKKLDAE